VGAPTFRLAWLTRTSYSWKWLNQRVIADRMARKNNIYRRAWDDYAAGWRKYIAESRPDLAACKDAWPGDEWGDEDSCRKIFKSMFADYGVASWKHCVEIGAGSGKYTDFVLGASTADVIAFDVSKKFIEVLSDRMKQSINEGRLDAVLLLGEHSNEMFQEINRRGLVRQIDAMYSIDAMVHVDLQYLMAYLVTAALVLKRGGYLIMTFANALSVHGFEELLDSTSHYYSTQGKPSAKFEWLSADLVRGLLKRLGFVVNFIPLGDDQGQAIQRDLYVVARLLNLRLADSRASAISITL
jgi:SAM-dependent methyltransferase